jgi:hypothetical protein
MITNFMKESEVKCIEYMIIKNNLCTSMEDINNTLEKDFKKNKKLIEYFKQKHDVSKKEGSFPVKKKYNKYNY